MKVAHVIVGGEIAGGQVICRMILEALRKRGDEVIVISPTSGDFTKSLEQERIRVHFIPFQKTYHIQNAIRLARTIKDEHVDIVHTHAMVPMNVQARLGARLAGIPCISHIHATNTFSANPFIRKYQILFDNWTSRFCNKLIAVSEATKQSLIDQGIPSDRVEVIPNGISTPEVNFRISRDEIFQKLGVPQNHHLIGMVGRLCPLKGQEEFIKAMTEVCRIIPNVTGVIIGKDTEFGGAYEAKLKGITKASGLNGRIIFSGHQADPFSFINAMDFLVLLSKTEGLPLVILEAMSLQKPVVATNVGGIPELVEDGKTGILVPPNNSNMLVQAMLRLLQNHSLTQEMGEAAFERVRERFSKERMCERILNLYDELAFHREKVRSVNVIP
ncbi:MAG: hypothetical protein A3C35_07225 [Omnitrophica bacterium RIFCSPHIGHO2_02_FULL_46_11]|nr:MAG: hypothetical protein A3C35_07225 [Omnitrophica bacterium RIFCSPHIGHO2_02_FULL_46_11]OGW87385.1 MAG: hypothetical protein A3A81_04665 [Omnitrophica bacterium RIFCSPLOWO2_01_FULL_45_10b]